MWVHEHNNFRGVSIECLPLSQVHFTNVMFKGCLREGARYVDFRLICDECPTIRQVAVTNVQITHASLNLDIISGPNANKECFPDLCCTWERTGDRQSWHVNIQRPCSAADYR